MIFKLSKSYNSFSESIHYFSVEFLSFFPQIFKLLRDFVTLRILINIVNKIKKIK